MRHLLAFAIAVMLAAVCTVVLHAQSTAEGLRAAQGGPSAGVSIIPLPLQDRSITVRLTGEADGVLGCGVASLAFEWPPNNPVNWTTTTFPFVFAANGGGIRNTWLFPDTVTETSFDLSGASTEMHVDALRMQGDRLLTVVSAQQQAYDCLSSVLGPATMRVRLVNGTTQRLLAEFPGGVEPTLLKDAAGRAHLVWMRQLPHRFTPYDSVHFTAYAGEICYALFAGDSLLSGPVVLGRGHHPKAAIDAGGMVHAAWMQYDSLPAPATRLVYAVGKENAWSAPRVLEDAFRHYEFDGSPYRFELYDLVDILALRADDSGVARIVLSQPRERNGRALLAFSSDGRKAVIDSSKLHAASTLAGHIAIEADGTIRCGMFAPGIARYPAPDDPDTLLLATVNAAMTQVSTVAYPPEANQSFYFSTVDSPRDGICLLAQRDSSLQVFAHAERGARKGQLLLADDIAWRCNDYGAVCDSTSAMWLAYYQRVPSNAPSAPALLRIASGTVGVPRIATPAALDLAVFPNPATSDATLRFSLPAPQSVTITVHDLLGREVLRAADGVRYGQGAHVLPMKLGGLARGVYRVRMLGASGEGTATLMLR
jgi:hypothetical protein